MTHLVLCRTLAVVSFFLLAGPVWCATEMSASTSSPSEDEMAVARAMVKSGRFNEA